MKYHTKNLKTTILTFFFFSFSLFSTAQYFEVGGTVGISLYSGDLSPSTKRAKLGKINPMAGVFARYNFNNFFTLRGGVNYGIVSADDAKADNPIKVKRNLSFRSNIIEGNLLLEINILGYQPYNLERPWSPYIFGGVALFHFNPKAKYNGEWVELQPLGTEGQGLSAYPERQKYNLLSSGLVFGGGVKYAINDQWNIGLEAGVRSTFTDYLDDVSTTYVEEALLLEQSDLAAALANRTGEPVEAGAGRGNATIKDYYAFAGVTISYNFTDNGLVGSRKRSRRSKDGCPTF